jgi:hypothetical protein
VRGDRALPTDTAADEVLMRDRSRQCVSGSGRIGEDLLDVGRLVTQIEDEEFWEEVLRREPLLIGISSGETDR